MSYEVTGKDDADKTNFMYLPFPTDRNVNPKHWESKLKFWKKEINLSCRFYGDICFNCVKLREVFSDANKRSPAGLMTVLTELYNSGDILLTSSFDTILNESWKQWGFTKLKKSSSWVWNRFWYTSGINELTDFVLKELLEIVLDLAFVTFGDIIDVNIKDLVQEMPEILNSCLFISVLCDVPREKGTSQKIDVKNQEYGIALLDAHYKLVKYDNTDNVVPWKVLLSVYKINGKKIPENNLVCIIVYLKNQRKCQVGVSDNGEKEKGTSQDVGVKNQIVKFRARDQKKVEAVTEIDFEIIKLKKAIAKLTMECNQLDKETKRLQADVKNTIRSKEKDKAKRFLAEKHKVEKTLKLKNDALFTMKENFRIIQEAETNKMITDAFNSSATILNNSYREQGLTLDRVDDVLEKAMEAKEMVNEIEEVLSTGIKQLGDDYDMEELNKELAELEATDLEDLKAGEEIIRLPDVPEGSPKKKEKTTVSKKREEAIPAT